MAVSSSYRRLRRFVVVAGVVVAIFAAIGGAWDAASRRLERWEHDLLPTSDDCRRSGHDDDDVLKTTHDKLELISKRPGSNVQLHIRCNLPVSQLST